MRIRQVRPEFFSDPVVGRLHPDARLSYIGLWCIADDAGWLEWDQPHIAAMLSPYESVPVRERRFAKAAEALVGAGRVIVHECGCAFIPRLADHQKIGGNKSFTVRDKHESRHSRTSTPVGSNGRYVGSPARAPESARGTDDELRAAFRRQGLPVEAALPGPNPSSAASAARPNGATCGSPSSTGSSPSRGWPMSTSQPAGTATPAWRGSSPPRSRGRSSTRGGPSHEGAPDDHPR